MKSFIFLLILIFPILYCYGQIEQIDRIYLDKRIRSAYFINDSTIIYHKSKKSENIIIYNLIKKKKQSLKIINKKAKYIIVSHDKKYIAAYCSNKSLYIYDIFKDSVIVNFKKASKEIPFMEFVPEANEIILLDKKTKELKLYSFNNKMLINSFQFQEMPLLMNYLPNLELISITFQKNSESQVFLYDKNTFTLKYKIENLDYGIISSGETRYKNKIFITSNRKLLLWDLNKNKKVIEIPEYNWIIYPPVFFNNYKNFISYGSEGSMFLWEFDNLKCIQNIKVQMWRSIYQLNKLNNSNLFLTVGYDDIKIWKINDY